MAEKQMRCKQEELPFMATFARDIYVRDSAEFKNYSPLFGDTFLAKYDEQMGIVGDLVAPAVLMAAQKTLTDRIEQHYTTARDYTNKIEGYAKLAADEKLLVTNVEDFGFKNLRAELNNKNDEGVVKKLRELLQHATANSAGMVASGFTAAVRLAFSNFIELFDKDIKDQKRKMEEHSKLINDNIGEFYTLWNMIAKIVDNGNIIFKNKDAFRAKEYTYTALLKKVHLKKSSDSTPPTTPGTTT